MHARQGERIAHGFITLAAFAVGLLLGPRLCAPPPSTSGDADGSRADEAAVAARQAECPPERVVTRTVELPPQIIYECPPEPEPPPVDAGGSGAAARKKPKVLPPEPEPELDPLLRKRLLAWVRDQSDELKACRDEGPELYRMTVLMHLDLKREGAVQRVDVNASRDSVPSAVLQCVRQRVRTWTPPAELTQQRSQLVFGLTL